MEALQLRGYLQERGLLDRFEDRAIAWAEKLKIEWIELEGELWTLVSELERKKGVEPGDFVRGSGLVAHELKTHEPSAALQRLLKVPGVKRASVPTTFRVEGGYALACGGVGALPSGITALVKQQKRGWALAGYTLVNVALALSYISHGRSDVAKATRDLVIGTTIDVGKVAAARENASAAVLPYAEGISKSQAAMLQYMQALQEEQAETKSVALGADRKADQAIAHASFAVSEVHKLRLLQPARRTVSKSQVKDRDRTRLKGVVMEKFNGCCPCCKEQVPAMSLQIDHWYTRERSDLGNFWAICVRCNSQLGEPLYLGANPRRQQAQRSFDAYQEMLNLPVEIQCTFDLS